MTLTSRQRRASAWVAGITLATLLAGCSAYAILGAHVTRGYSGPERTSSELALIIAKEFKFLSLDGEPLPAIYRQWHSRGPSLPIGIEVLPGRHQLEVWPVLNLRPGLAPAGGWSSLKAQTVTIDAQAGRIYHIQLDLLVEDRSDLRLLVPKVIDVTGTKDDPTRKGPLPRI